MWAVAPVHFGTNNPRGLIRLAYPVLPNGRYSLVNFIAIEPIVGGQRGFSELEQSKLDGVPGKRIWTKTRSSMILTNLPGRLSNGPAGEKEIEVKFKVEKFDNGAHVGLVIRQRVDAPDEIELPDWRPD